MGVVNGSKKFFGPEPEPWIKVKTVCHSANSDCLVPSVVRITLVTDGRLHARDRHYGSIDWDWT